MLGPPKIYFNVLGVLSFSFLKSVSKLKFYKFKEMKSGNIDRPFCQLLLVHIVSIYSLSDTPETQLKHSRCGQKNMSEGWQKLVMTRGWKFKL